MKIETFRNRTGHVLESKAIAYICQIVWAQRSLSQLLQEEQLSTDRFILVRANIRISPNIIPVFFAKLGILDYPLLLLNDIQIELKHIFSNFARPCLRDGLVIAQLIGANLMTCTWTVIDLWCTVTY